MKVSVVIPVVYAQFWRNYIDMVDIYMLFSRAVQTNDVDLFIFMLGEKFQFVMKLHLHL